eukprot:2757477-Alexandrium_andersonii.AAC.1
MSGAGVSRPASWPSGATRGLPGMRSPGMSQMLVGLATGLVPLLLPRVSARSLLRPSQALCRAVVGWCVTRK